MCHKAKKLKLSGNKTIDDFIRYIQTNSSNFLGKMKFSEYRKYKNVELIASGGFSKIYKATTYRNSQPVILKKLNNSKDITQKELNEVRTIFY